jgi:hypothetical protein
MGSIWRQQITAFWPWSDSPLALNQRQQITAFWPWSDSPLALNQHFCGFAERWSPERR